MLLSRVRPIVLAIRRARNLFLRTLDSPVAVLLYHRVAALASDPQQLAVSPDNFREQMVYLKERYPLVRFEDDWSDVRTPSVAVTFDDGYADNALNALPILEEVGIPVTFFVSIGNLDTEREYWWDELERIILGDLTLPESFTLNDSRYGRRWLTDTIAARKSLYVEITPLMKKIAAERRDDWLRQLRRWAGTDETGRSAYRAMTSSELLHLAGSKWVTIGAHTVTHSRLSALSEEQQREEIFSSKRQLEALLRTTVTTFSYPFGRRDDYNRTSINLCREAGFLRAAANFYGLTYRWTDTMQVPRHLVRNWGMEEFDSMMKEFGAR
jgi:peptidoglycan/xylan/chitin deacetylase (PgdA/CDA1 family)